MHFVCPSLISALELSEGSVLTAPKGKVICVMEKLNEQQREHLEKGYRKVVNGLATIVSGYSEIAVVSEVRLSADERRKRGRVLKMYMPHIQEMQRCVPAIRKRITWKPLEITRRAESRLSKLMKEAFYDPWRHPRTPYVN